jgi:Tat protein translocase TatB subunit
MFDIGWSEILVIVVVALVVIGPKDLPKAIYEVGKWVRKARLVAREFQVHLDDVMREAELDEFRKQAMKARDVNLAQAMESAVDPTGELKTAFDPTGELKTAFDLEAMQASVRDRSYPGSPPEDMGSEDEVLQDKAGEDRAGEDRAGEDRAGEDRAGEDMGAADTGPARESDTSGDGTAGDVADNPASPATEKQD